MPNVKYTIHTISRSQQTENLRLQNKKEHREKIKQSKPEPYYPVYQWWMKEKHKPTQHPYQWWWKPAK